MYIYRLAGLKRKISTTILWTEYHCAQSHVNICNCNAVCHTSYIWETVDREKLALIDEPQQQFFALFIKNSLFLT